MYLITGLHYTNKVKRKVMTAQAVIESGWGTSKISRSNRNLFGIKGSGTNGKKNGHANYSYLNDSIKAYVNLMNTSDYYKKAREVNKKHPKSVKKFVNAFAETYAPNQGYGENVIDMVNSLSKKI